ncbi:hypothetical protein AGMMS49965_24380 [Bacteroidia bacterium]|nr:hypothetical protein AGMMS49965_24380 [Bacteroidia bacterium]
MKQSKFISAILLATVFLGFAACGDEDETIPQLSATFDVSAGTLSSLIGTKKVTDLKLTGQLNGDDINTIREMWWLSVLDIGDASIVSGGSAYFTNTYTANNVIGNGMFGFFAPLTSVILPNNVIEIGSGAFEGCPLTSVTIPNSVTFLHRDAFHNCKDLTSITIGSGVTEIADYKSTMTYDGYYAFKGCTSLKEFIVSEQNAKFFAVDGVLFENDNYNHKTLLIYPMAKENTSYAIPDGMTKIGRAAFSGSTLTSITIPASVSVIHNDAFVGNSRLTEIHIKRQNPPGITDGTVAGPFKNVKLLYVPVGSLAAYKVAKYWRDISHIIEE